MFPRLTDGLREDIQTFKGVLDAHDTARASYQAASTEPDPWASVRGLGVAKEWHVYDHCAAFTRLYAIYATFVDELFEEYLGILPTLYTTYKQLPSAVLTQHRVGVAQILGKLGETGMYSHLDEKELITTISHGLSGGAPYKLIKHAFLTERQNYRLEVLGRLLGSLGIENGARQLSTNAALRAFLETAKPEATTVESELDQFVKRRNEAAHTDVSEIVATEQIKQTADFLLGLGNALAEVLMNAITRRRYNLGHFPRLGVVEKTYKQGSVVISHLEPCMIRLHDQIVLVRGGAPHLATVTSLQCDDVEQELILLTARAEIGIGLDYRTKEGAAIHALREQQTSPYQVLQVFAARRDDIVDQLSDHFRALGFAVERTATLALESLDAVELDTPQLRAITDREAVLGLAALVTFTATATYEERDVAIDDPEGTHTAGTVTVQRTVRMPVDLRFEYDTLADLADTQHARILINSVNDGNPVMLPLEVSEYPLEADA